MKISLFAGESHFRGWAMYNGEFIDKVRGLNKTLKPKMPLKELAKALHIGSWHTLRKYLKTAHIPLEVLDRADIIFPILIEDRLPKPEPSESEDPAPENQDPHSRFLAAAIRRLKGPKEKKPEIGFQLGPGGRITLHLRNVEKQPIAGGTVRRRQNRMTICPPVPMTRPRPRR